MDRLFHQRFTISAKSGITLFTVLAGYFFWEKKAVIALLLMVVIIGMIERVIHTTYTFKRIKPIDKDEEYDFLIINRGRFSRIISIPVVEITRTSVIKTSLGLGHYILLEYGEGNMIGVQPENDDAFLAEIKHRGGDKN
nr:hypothetical protein [Prevotella sp.]